MTDIQVIETSALQAITDAEINQAIATAKRFPREIARSLDRAKQMVLSSQDITEECHYSLPRKDGGKTKNIEGPSVRFAEILASAWGNCRAGARVLDTSGREATCQGIFIDCETNVQTFKEVRRRLTTRDGRRYGDDMVNTTANAGCSVAYRNAVLAGIPKALWNPVYREVLKKLHEGKEPIGARRTRALSWFDSRGVDAAAVLKLLGVAKVGAITAAHLVRLNGLKNAINEESATVAEVFGFDPDAPEAAPPVVEPAEVGDVEPEDDGRAALWVEWLEVSGQLTAGQLTEVLRAIDVKVVGPKTDISALDQAVGLATEIVQGGRE